MTVCYFTASGNCLYVARRIGGKLLSIPQLMKEEQIEIEDDAVGIVCPVYAVEMPMMVRDFLAKAKIKTEYFFFIYTYGMGYAAAFAHAELAAREKGLKINYINAVQMVDNYLPGFEMQKQIETLPQKDVEGQIKKICEDISLCKEKGVKVTAVDKMQMAMFKKMLAKRILRKDAAQGYVVNGDCVRCGICAKVCPANNITVTQDGICFHEKCEVCYACLHNCPKNAIHIKGEKSSARFRNENILLMDIIKANE